MVRLCWLPLRGETESIYVNPLSEYVQFYYVLWMKSDVHLDNW